MNLWTSNLLSRTALRALGTIAALGLFLASSPAFAQSPSPFAVQTNIPGVYAYVQPPAGFDPLTAPAADLELYGYPPRPAPGEPAEAFARWAKVVNPALNRVVPQLVPTNIYHRPIQGLQITQGAKPSQSYNWSGYAVVHKKPAFTSVTGTWIIPTVQQAFGSCTGGWDYSAQWVGIDGFSNKLLEQSGSGADAYCNGSTKATSYYPWIEWLPAPEYELVGDPLYPGDYVEVTVAATDWSGGESSNGTLVYTDVTQNWQISISFTAASIGGNYVVGESAEWIVEAPEVGGNIATLANYVTDPWFGTTAADTSHKTYLPGSSKGATANAVSMVDSGGGIISSVDLLGTDSLWFFVQGSAK
ncbi:MAG TPA: G1 family glutamic endopeptidase [Candidatus Binataceae bacterium]|nr:G1 family glutamic endopeptidase [Candidatus Binataceae bacterium]